MRWVLVLSLVTACVRSEVVVCSDGRACPHGYTCDVANNRCIGPAQTAPCVGRTEGEACAIDNVPGACASGVCELQFCGDGTRRGVEACDGGDLGGATCSSLHFYGETTGLACFPDCTFDTRGCSGACGDGVKNGDELCDGDDLGTPAADCTAAGYYNAAGLACSAFCTYDVTACTGSCGNNIVDGPELCDGAAPQESCFDAGLDAGGLGCNVACSYDLASCARFGFRFDATLASTSASVVHAEASASDNVWVIDSAFGVHHYDGSAWTVQTLAASGALVEVETTGPDRAWIVDGGGALWQFDGTSWTKDLTAPAGITSVWAAGPNDVWVATTSNGVRRKMGSTWSAVGALAITNLTLIRGRTVDDVWASTLDGSAHHWNGTSWASRPITNGMFIADAYVAGPNEAWFVGGIGLPTRAHWTGSSYTYDNDVPGNGAGYKRITATGPSDIWILRNENGGVEHYDGTTWSFVRTSADATMVAIDPSDVLLFSSTNVLYRFTGQVYAEIQTPPSSVTYELFTTRTGHVFAVAGGNVTPAHWDGLAWTNPIAAPSHVDSVWGVSETDVWGAMDNGKPIHFDGSTWTAQTSVANTSALKRVWGSGATDVWFGGTGGVVLHYNGTFSNRNIPGVSSGVPILYMTGSGPNDVWAVTSVGALYHWTGSWAPVALPGGVAGLYGIASAGPNALFAILDNKVFRLTGTTWSEQALPPTEGQPLWISASAPDDVFVLAPPQGIVHFDGARWALVRPPADQANGSVLFAYPQPHRIDFFISNASPAVRTLLRTRPWTCTASEANRCNDTVDNDCDGAVDAADTDC